MGKLIADKYNAWKAECNTRFQQLKANEEELNRIFIDIYGLQDELTPDVADKDVTVHIIFDSKEDVLESLKGSNYVRTKRDEVVSLLSYAVGCMFGRYSIYTEGLFYAGGFWDYGSQVDRLCNFAKTAGYERYQPMSIFLPDRDNCIPITDEEYFNNDIVKVLTNWLKKVYGEDTLEENLDFIASALGNKGNSSRGIIRNYFLSDFFKDHTKTYQKRPIGNVRVDYLHKIHRVYESEIQRMQEIIDASDNAREISAAEKRKTKLNKQLKECQEYDTKIAHLALARIDIDLDDGVKVNYEKVQTAADGKKLEILARIK